MRWHIGAFEFDEMSGCLIGTEEVRLGSNESRLLKFLIENYGTTYSKDNIVSAVWENPGISDDSLFKAIEKLKLGFGEKWNTYLAVRPYRLIVKPEPIPDNMGVGRLINLARDRMQFHTRESISTALALYEDALAIEPENEVALIGSALAHINQSCVGFGSDLPERAIRMARENLAMILGNKELPSALALRGLTHMVKYEWQAASTDIERALEIDSNNAYAHLFKAHLETARGRSGLGLTHARKAAALDALSPMALSALARLLVFADRVEEAHEAMKRVMKQFDPFPIAHQVRGEILEQMDDVPGAIQAYERVLDFDFLPEAVASLAHIYGKTNTTEGRRRAREQREKLEEAVKGGKTKVLAGYLQALVAVGEGRDKDALSWLRKAYEQRNDWLIYINVEPRFKPLRRYRDFSDLLALVFKTDRLSSMNSRRGSMLADRGQTFQS